MPMPPGGSRRTARRAPTRGAPVTRGRNGFQAAYAAKSLRMSQTRADSASISTAECRVFTDGLLHLEGWGCGRGGGPDRGDKEVIANASTAKSTNDRPGDAALAAPRLV